MSADRPVVDSPTARGSAWEVLRVFTRLGLTSFGGPVAHLGYFRTEFVERRRWLTEPHYADLVALCQFLPGPASSQVGMALGLGRAGWWGALAAWVGFTLPSAMALIAFALGVSQWQALAQSGAVHGLKVVAVAVVAQAVWGMGKSLCPDWPRAALALACAVLVLAVPGAAGQVGAIALGALVGHVGLRLPAQPAGQHRPMGVSKRVGAMLLVLFALLLLALPLLAASFAQPWLQAAAAVYQAGALVFGGGHVVLPLLQAGVVQPGWMTNDVFLAGYGAAQAVPGPLFSFAAYLGAALPMQPAGWFSGLGGWTAGLALLVVIFLPAFLLVAGALPFWEVLRQRAGMRRAMAGANAAVVGVLAAALVGPLWASAILSIADFALALLCLVLLLFGRVSPVWVVVVAAGAGWLWL